MSSKLNTLARMNPEIMAIGIIYNSDMGYDANDGRGLQGARIYDYLAPTNMGIAVNDRVVVVTGKSEVKVATVVRVNDVSALNWNVPYNYKWVITKVDLAPYEQHLKDLIALANQDQAPKDRELSDYEKGNQR